MAKSLPAIRGHFRSFIPEDSIGFRLFHEYLCADEPVQITDFMRLTIMLITFMANIMKPHGHTKGVDILAGQRRFFVHQIVQIQDRWQNLICDPPIVFRMIIRMVDHVIAFVAKPKQFLLEPPVPYVPDETPS